MITSKQQLVAIIYKKLALTLIFMQLLESNLNSNIEKKLLDIDSYPLSAWGAMALKLMYPHSELSVASQACP